MLEPLEIKFSKLSPNARLPEYAHGFWEDAGMDLYSNEWLVIEPGATYIVGTGLIVALPPGYVGDIRTRSGMAAKEGVVVLNSPGTLDPGYRGELRVILHNFGMVHYTIHVGDRIAQMVVHQYTPVVVREVPKESLSASKRGEGGFGSTGT